MEDNISVNDDKVIVIEKINIYQSNVLILTNVSMSVSKGEFLYIIGPTGSGKSSLLKTLYAELPVNDGFARVAEYDLKALKSKEIPFLRRKLGIVFQDFQLLMDRTVYDNLLFVMKATGWTEKADMLKRANEVLENVGIGSKGAKMPHQLSGGEQQRVGIARALLNYPEILIADEPTGNLDPNTSEDIMKILFEVSRAGTAVITATHDYSLFRRFPARTLRIEDGLLIEKSST
jgi:cell division transport system ATP-binding protein